MVKPRDLLHRAARFLGGLGEDRGAWDEHIAREAAHLAYYAVFHMLAEDGGTRAAGNGGTELAGRVARCFDHRQMKAACVLFSKWGRDTPSALLPLVPGGPDPSLRLVAEAFLELQEWRHRADYDLSARLQVPDALRLVGLAHDAFAAWDKVRTAPSTQVFSLTLLLGDRLYRRG